jgi:SAM-dependent methyltransferase
MALASTSPMPSCAQAEAAACGVTAWETADFVCADVYALPEGLEGRFDLALITIGVINWMPDLPRFLKVAASLLVPGGRLVIYETHPVLDMFEPYGADPHAALFLFPHRAVHHRGRNCL